MAKEIGVWKLLVTHDRSETICYDEIITQVKER